MFSIRRASVPGCWLVGLLACGGCMLPGQRFRAPAPAEDTGPLIAVPVLGKAAGRDDAVGQLHTVEWVAKRTWHVLGLPYERKDYKGPPDLEVQRHDGFVELTGGVASGGVPLRNQIVTGEIEQQREPVLLYLRSTDAFGEVLIELDLLGGSCRARSVTVSRTMIGGQSHSSPMPEQSSNRIITASRFAPAGPGWHRLKLEARGSHVTINADDRRIVQFEDPDPAGGKYGFGSVGTVRVRNVEQWELISPAEKNRREVCLRDMHALCKGIDAEYEGDVRKANVVEVRRDDVVWTWPPTGAKATFSCDDRGRPAGRVEAGLYGNDTLIDGVFPEVVATAADGRTFRSDASRDVCFDADSFGISMTAPLVADDGTKARAHIRIQFTVLTVWWWTITIEGFESKSIQASLGVAPQFARKVDASEASDMGDMAVAVATVKGGGRFYRHNAKAGVFIKALTPDTTLGTKLGGAFECVASTTANKLRFATLWLPAQPLNHIGFSKRMVHYIKYPEGPVQHWRRGPSFQEYPTNVDLARYHGHGCEAMVWHHTWTSNDYRDREGFLVNHAEMKRAMDETHRLGMAAIGYIGIVPGRNALLRFDDAIDNYQKNWDLQDFTFYSTHGRWQEFFPWMTDYWCREYGLDGFYADGALGSGRRGKLERPLYPEDAELSEDELQHRLYYRVRKVLERHGARFGLEQWGGSHDMLVTGFYDCRMIGESFQEAPPEHYREGYNALITGTPFKMYGMRESSQNPYNIAMAAVCMSDIQVCSGNGAWGDVADTTDTWARVQPLWDLLESIDYDALVEARPWYAQELVSGDGFYAGNYTEPNRVLVFLANRSEQAGTFDVRIDLSHLPPIDGTWRVRYVLGRTGDAGSLGDGRLSVDLPALHDGPIGLELTASR